MSTPRAAGPDSVAAALRAAMEHVDHPIFLSRFTIGTNTNIYSPEAHFLTSPITATIKSGRVVILDGQSDAVRKFKAHRKMVADLFGLMRCLSIPGIRA
ncbi:hypothetical protein [Ruegeria sp. ANG-R]|uniref:hypothetical protein n=1 Tax=Ruegeria sp. ANG-R TaxID=1577903 RepID=UPI00126A31B4|nr:hypothetical protein [Ruegeria sp. ANG-R]